MEGVAETKSKRSRQFGMPPVPPEHGAWVMLGVALTAPLVIALVRSVPDTGQLLGYGLLVLLAVTTLFFREAVRRRLRARPGEHGRLRRIAVVEAVVLLSLVFALVALAGRWWALGVFVIPAVLGDVWIRRRGWPIPLGGELSGVIALSLAVPAGALLLGVGIEAILVVWSLYVVHHVAGVLRVQLAIGRNDLGRRRALGVLFHAFIALLMTGLWMWGYVGPGAPLVFVAGAGRAGFLSKQEETTQLKTVGKWEGILSTIFVLAAPWIVP